MSKIGQWIHSIFDEDETEKMETQLAKMHYEQEHHKLHEEIENSGDLSMERAFEHKEQDYADHHARDIKLASYIDTHHDELAGHSDEYDRLSFEVNEQEAHEGLGGLIDDLMDGIDRDIEANIMEI